MQSQQRQLWRSFVKLLGRGKTPLSSDIDVSALHQFLDDKVAGVRAVTAPADVPRFTPRSGVSSVSLLQSHSASLTLCRRGYSSVNVLAPFLCWLFCRSLEHGVVPSSSYSTEQRHVATSAYITPILKKADLGSSDPESYPHKRRHSC